MNFVVFSLPICNTLEQINFLKYFVSTAAPQSVRYCTENARKIEDINHKNEQSQ